MSRLDALYNAMSFDLRPGVEQCEAAEWPADLFPEQPANLDDRAEFEAYREYLDKLHPEVPRDPELDQRCDEQRAEAIEHMEHRCLLHPLDCEHCQERAWPSGSMP